MSELEGTFLFIKSSPLADGLGESLTIYKVLGFLFFFFKLLLLFGLVYVHAACCLNQIFENKNINVYFMSVLLKQRRDFNLISSTYGF